MRTCKVWWKHDRIKSVWLFYIIQFTDNSTQTGNSYSHRAEFPRLTQSDWVISQVRFNSMTGCLLLW